MIVRPTVYVKNLHLYIFVNYFALLTASLNALPALKTGAFDTGIFISSPVLYAIFVVFVSVGLIM